MHGRQFKTSFSTKKKTKKSEWFNTNCKQHKDEFYRCKRLFNFDASEANKRLFLNARNAYCKVKRSAKKSFSTKEKSVLSNLSKSNPRKFWKHINRYKSKNSTNNNLPEFNNFVDHFKNVSNMPHSSTFDRDEINDSDDNNVSIEMLDRPFSSDEIIKTINMLHRHKSADISGNVADFFIDSKEFIVPYLSKLFNFIYDNGVYPELWTKGLIVPIHKKDDHSDPKNYRGITLVNIISKIFSLT